MQTATYLVLKLDKCETFADALFICWDADPLHRSISFEQLAQVLLLDRSRDVGDVQFSLVRVGVRTALLARRVRDLSDQGVARLQFATVKRERCLRMCLSSLDMSCPLFEPNNVEMTDDAPGSRTERSRSGESPCSVCSASGCQRSSRTEGKLKVSARGEIEFHV